MDGKFKGMESRPPLATTAALLYYPVLEGWKIFSPCHSECPEGKEECLGPKKLDDAGSPWGGGWGGWILLGVEVREVPQLFRWGVWRSHLYVQAIMDETKFHTGKDNMLKPDNFILNRAL